MTLGSIDAMALPEARAQGHTSPGKPNGRRPKRQARWADYFRGGGITRFGEQRGERHAVAAASDSALRDHIIPISNCFLGNKCVIDEVGWKPPGRVLLKAEWVR